MPFYLTHPEHGTHICYTPEDVERHKAQGWKPQDEDPEKPQTLTLKKRGRPAKVKPNGDH